MTAKADTATIGCARSQPNFLARSQRQFAVNSIANSRQKPAERGYEILERLIPNFVQQSEKSPAAPDSSGPEEIS